MIREKINKIFNLSVLVPLAALFVFFPFNARAATWVQTSQADFESGSLSDVDTSSSPGDVKLSASAAYFYALRGRNSNDFWRYNASLDSWSVMANTPNNVDDGGSIAYDGSNYIYALRGNNQSNFWRYDISTNSWSSMTNAPGRVQDGGSLAYNKGNYIYALRGRNSNNFWRYDISTNSWSSMSNTPARVRDGGCLVFTGGNYLYALRGRNSNNFWRYDISTNSWSSMSNAPSTVHDGGAITFDEGNYLYAFRGQFSNNFWRYDISANSWSSMSNSPVTIEDGGSLAHDGNNHVYALRGINTNTAGKYNISTNSWSSIATTPQAVDDGGALALGATGYVNSGTLASQVFDNGTSGSNWDSLSWNETLVASTDITFEVRASDTSFLKDDPAPSWSSVGGTSPITSGLPSGQYMQWRATLTSSNPLNTPTLHDVTTSYSVSGDTVSVTPSDIAPGNINPSANVAFEKISLATNANDATWTDIRVDKIGTASDSEVSQIKIYYDNDSNGSFDGTETLIGSGTFSSGISNINLSSSQTITTTPKDYFIVLEISSTASGGLTLGVQCITNSYFTVDSPDSVSLSNFPFNSSLATVNSTISISSPPDLTLSPNIFGIAGGVSNGETTWNITTNAYNGYSMQWKASTQQMINADSDMINAFTPVVADTPEIWSVDATSSEWGARLKSTSTSYNSSVWGVNDGVASKWLNVKISDHEVIQRNSKTSPSGDFQTVQFRAEIGNNSFQEDGSYSTIITITAVTL